MATKGGEPDWLRLQKKIFTRYVNQKLRERKHPHTVQDLIGELKDGTLLLTLTEILSGKNFEGKKPPQPKQKIQQIDYCSKALEFVKQCGIKTNISPENLVNGDEKLVFGLIFTVIVKYMKFDEEGEGNQSGDVKEALMLWLKNKTVGYRDVNLENFTKSFHDGLPFCALIHKMRPKLIPYENLKKENKIDNLKLAMTVAEKYCNVEKYLEPEDIAKLDETSMIIYLNDWYYGIALLQKQDIAARRVAKLINMTELHDKMRADYIAGGNALKQWVDSKIPVLNDRKFDDTLNGIKKRLDGFYDYKANEKSNKIAEHLDINALFQNLALRLQNNKRPPFKPPQDVTPQALDKKFEELEKAEIACAAALHAELTRQIKLHNMAKRLKADAENLKAWVTEKKNFFTQSEKIDSVESAEFHLENAAINVRETKNARETRLADLKKIAAELYKERFENSNEIKGVESNLDTLFDETNKAAADKTKKLEQELENQKAINDRLCKEFSEAVKDFSDWLNQKKYHLSAEKNVDLEQQLKELESGTADHSNADQKLKVIDERDAKVKERQITNNPYTNVTAQDCKAQWAQFQILVQKKRELLQSAIEEKKKSGLTDEQLQEIRDNFKYFDKDGNGFLERRELRACLQSLGENATNKDIDDMLKEYDTDKDGKMKFEEFQKFMFKQLGDSDTADEIIQSFKFISLEKDYVKTEQLESIVNNVSFKDKHVDYLKKEMKPKGEGLDFPTWTKEVFDR